VDKPRPCFTTWPKLTGGKGIHLMAPLQVLATHDEAPAIARGLVSDLSVQFPDEYILSAQARRRGRMFLDYLRNGRGTPRPRAREGFPIAAPVTWSRIESGIQPDAFTMDRPFRAPPV
jgi:bifunctional non-homologous end joining protein LigD